MPGLWDMGMIVIENKITRKNEKFECVLENYIFMKYCELLQ